MRATPEVVDNAAASRFEIRAPGGTPLLKYARRDGVLDLVHTEVPPQMEGKGYGGALAKAALDAARAAGLRVVPSCPFVREYVERHREYADLVAGER
jgi:predicted GNAT family acetyltransferase